MASLSRRGEGALLLGPVTPSLCEGALTRRRSAAASLRAAVALRAAAAAARRAQGERQQQLAQPPLRRAPRRRPGAAAAGRCLAAALAAALLDQGQQLGVLQDALRHLQDPARARRPAGRNPWRCAAAWGRGAGAHLLGELAQLLHVELAGEQQCELLQRLLAGWGGRC
jgi:hypothetical protein